jgi:hypothetical protein
MENIGDPMQGAAGREAVLESRWAGQTVVESIQQAYNSAARKIDEHVRKR